MGTDSRQLHEAKFFLAASQTWIHSLLKRHGSELASNTRTQAAGWASKGLLKFCYEISTPGAHRHILTSMEIPSFQIVYSAPTHRAGPAHRDRYVHCLGKKKTLLKAKIHWRL